MDALPKDGLFRSSPGLELRDDAASTMPRLTGYAIRFNEPTEIHSFFEGDFIERIAPGATTKTLAENRGLRILLNHGSDPQVGEKPLAPPAFAEDEHGVRFDDPELFDTSYNRDLVPILRAGQFGASFKFRVMAENVVKNPEASDENPDRLPERTITELKMYEAGPVTFPAYEGATAGARSLTDAFRDRLPENVDDLFERWALRHRDRVLELLAVERVEVELTGDASKAAPQKLSRPHRTTSQPRPGSRALTKSLAGVPHSDRTLSKSLHQ